MFNRVLINQNANYLQLIRMFSSKIRLVIHGRDSVSESRDSFKMIKELKGEGYDERNKRLNRPLSPHLSIYKLQSNMIMSMGHRVTGAALSGLLSGLAFVVTFSPVPFSDFIQILEGVNFYPILLLGSKFCIALIFSFHMLTSIRHLIWDCNPNLLRSKSVDVSGYLLLMISVMLAIHLTMLSG